PDPRLWAFLIGFARHSTRARWEAGIRAYAPVSRRAFDAYERLAEGGVAEPVREADPFLVGFRTQGEAAPLLDELKYLREAGLEVEYDMLDGPEARDLEPALSAAVGAAIRLYGQRYINPVLYMEALARSVRERGGVIREGAAVVDVRDEGSQVTVELEGGDTLTADAVVLAVGAELSSLARRFGVRVFVQAGRGYSFSVPMRRVPAGPVYFPVQRVACTP